MYARPRLHYRLLTLCPGGLLTLCPAPTHLWRTVVKLRRGVKSLQSKSVARRKMYPALDHALKEAQEERFVQGRKQWRTWFVQPEPGKPVIVL
jgi:hypothetical protein